MRKFFLVILTFLFLALTTAATVATAQDFIRRESIVAIYQDFKIIFNGRLITTPIEPFQVESGQLMVPLRTVAEALGYQVEWDPITKAVYIEDEYSTGERPVLKPKYIEELSVLRNVGPFFNLQSREITIAGRKFKHGLVVELERMIPLKAGEKTENNAIGLAETVIDLKGKYSWFEGYLGVDDETRNSIGTFVVTILGDGIPLHESKTIKPSEYPLKFRLNIHNVKRLTLQAKWLEGEVGDDDKLWAAFADLLVY